MESTERRTSSIIEINGRRTIYSVLYTEDGKHLLGGGAEGMLRRWRVGDGNEVGEPIPTDWAEIFASALSPDRRWLVCGLRHPDSSDGKARAAVWDMQTQEKALDIKAHTDTVFSVDVSPDSTKFATGSADKCTFIWCMRTGKRLIGPLEHEGVVVAVRFSPNGDRIATVTAGNLDENEDKSIRIYGVETGQQLLDIPFRAKARISSPLAWSSDGCQLYSTSYGEVKRFNTSSGSLLGKWSVPGGGSRSSIVLSRNEKFAVVMASKSISFWDISTQTQIGSAVQYASDVWSMALTPSNDRIATGEQNGKIIVRGLRDLLPLSYLTVNLPFMYIYEGACKSWTQGDLSHVEELLTEEIAEPFPCARALAQRALVRSRLKKWDSAVGDAKKSIAAQRSVIGHIALAVAFVGSGDYESGIHSFDLVFTDSLATDNNFLLLIKAILIFESGRYYEAVMRVNTLVDIVDDKPLYIAVRTQMFLLYGGSLLRIGDYEHGITLLAPAQHPVRLQPSSRLMLISLMFGWNFDDHQLSMQFQIQENIKYLEDRGDIALQLPDTKEAVLHYSAALSLTPLNLTDLLVKRSKARAKLGLWEEALEDANKAIKSSYLNPMGYERRHAALHALQRYDEAMDAFNRMYSLIEGSRDPAICQLGNKYISPIRSEKAIEDGVLRIFKTYPLVLIDVKSGRLCDGPERMRIFKLELEFKGLHSCLTEELDDERILGVVGKYFQYVTLSHMWEREEPSFQDVKAAGSVWDLNSSPFNQKLRRFCEVVRNEGYRWAWSDTCCIDKMISTVLNQSLTMMYRWYEASAATLVHLADVISPSALGDLKRSIWMTRAWTTQELLAPKVIRFYTCDWQPYLGDTRSNHKESPKIMQELADTIGVDCKKIISFHPDALGIQEKLRLVSTRNASIEEDVAYSLMGIFKSDIVPRYGEGTNALGRLLEEIVTRSGESKVLAWNGTSSTYNSCLPATVAVYRQPLRTILPIADAKLRQSVEELRGNLSREDVIQIYNRVAALPAARFSNRRLHLPCVTFIVRRLDVQDLGHGRECRYRAWVPGIGNVEFQTLDRLSHMEPRRLTFALPWIRDLHDPLAGFPSKLFADLDLEDRDDNKYESRSTRSGDVGSPASTPSESDSESDIQVQAAFEMNSYTLALKLVVRLQHPFHALLLQEQSIGEYKRVAAEHEISFPGIEVSSANLKHIRTAVVDIL